MNRSAKIASALAVALFGASVASATEGFYVGGGVLQSRFDSDNFSVDDIDNDDTSWKVLAGFRLTPNFALEGAYTRFGEATAPSVAVGGPFEARANAFSAFGIGLWPIGPVDLFAKVGAARIDARGNVGAVFFDDEEIEFAYGVGAQFNIGPVALRAEYEKFDTDVIGDLDVISLNVVFTFGAR